MESISNSTRKSRAAVQPYQPVWMAHWMRAGSNSTAERRDEFARGSKELDRVSKDDDSTNGLEASGSVKAAALIETKTHSSLIKQDADKIQAIRPILSHNLERGNGGIRFPAADEGTSKNPVGSSTHIVPYRNLGKNEFDKGKAVICPLVRRPSIVPTNQLPNTKLKIVEQEHCQKYSQSACLIREGKLGIQSESDTSMNASFRKCNTSLLLDAPSMNKDWFQKIPNFSGIALLPPNQCTASEKNDSRISHYDDYSLHKLPNCAHDMKTMRICTTVDSVEAMPGGVPRFSQTTHSLLITKKTDANMANENDMFRRLLTKMSNNPSTDPHIVPPFFSQTNRGVKLQSLSSSSTSEGQGDARKTRFGTSKVAIKNESSAETDTMDMEFLKEDRPNAGANSSCSTKGFNSVTNLPPQFDVASSRDAKRRWTSTLPDINLEFPALPATASSSENVGPTSSRTQSLEMDTLLAHADPTTRWVKRLMPSSSDSSARGTKSSNLPANSSYDKKRKFLKSILKNSITGRETSLFARSGDSSNEDECFTVDPTEKGKELLSSQSWIKRWLRNGPRKKPEALVVCEPQSLKLSLDDLQKKQFPSIAAMALMGKAMNGFQSCELQKQGSYTVWNTKAF